MKEYAAYASNITFVPQEEEVEGSATVTKLLPCLEAVIVTTEPEYVVKPDSGMVKERKSHNHRVCFTKASLGHFLEQLQISLKILEEHENMFAPAPTPATLFEAKP